MNNNPSPYLVLLTTQKINNFLKSLNQNESYISEAWVFNTLKKDRELAKEINLQISDEELSDRVTTIAARRLHANILTHERFKRDWQSNMYRSNKGGISDFENNTASQIAPRGDFANRIPRNDGKLPNRFIELKN
jgi:ABC-type ATPase with predicted acetyltransferase domain